MGVEVIKHKSAVPGFARVALGSNSAPAWCRFSFWLPKERACLIWISLVKLCLRGMDDCTSLLRVHLLKSGKIRVSCREESKTLLLQGCSCRSGPHGRGL